MTLSRWLADATLPEPPARIEAAFAAATAAAAAGYYAAPHPILAACFAGALLLLGWVRLQVVLMAVLATAPFFRFPNVLDPTLLGFAGRTAPIEVSLAESLLVIATAAWALRRLRPPAPADFALPSLGPAGWLPAVAFIAAGLFSLPAADHRTVALREFRLVVLEPAVFYLLLVHTLRTRAEVMRFLVALVAVGGAIGVYSLCHYLFIGVVERTGGVQRILAVYHSPNALALFLGRVLPVAAVLAWGVWVAPSRGIRWRWGVGLAFGASLAAMGMSFYLTYSRGALLGLGAALVFGLLLINRRAAVALVLGTAVLAAAAVPFLPHDRMLATTPLLQRTYVWEAALAMVRDHPVLGVGLDNFLYHYPRYLVPQAALEPDMSHPHNLVLDHWLRLGLFGLAVTGGLQVFFWVNLTQLLRKQPDLYVRIASVALGASMVDFLVHGLIDNSYFLIDLAYIFWLTLGLMAILVRTQRVERAALP